MDFDLDEMEGGKDLPCVLVIDDDQYVHELVENALHGCCVMVFAETGEDGLALAEEESPKVVLVDVELPGKDGYEICRILKEGDRGATPVIFLSGHDKLEDRLKGYDAGGEDYVTKPFEPLELRAKVQHLLGVTAQQTELKSMADFASSTAMTAMTSMGEMGALLESLKHFNVCNDFASLAEATLAGLALYDLQGCVQIRTHDGTLTQSTEGRSTPLEESVIEKMASMERIMQFKTRMSITYEHISILVRNMPVDDAERCGRLRDHLAMLVEGAQVRLTGILASISASRRGNTILNTAARISQALHEIDEEQRRSRINTRMAVDHAMQRFEHAFLPFALSDDQESFLFSTIREGLDEIINTQSRETDFQNRLTAIIEELQLSLKD